MILILTDENEPTTDLIIDWLLKLEKPFVRISSKYTISITAVYHNPMDHLLEMIFSFERDGEVTTIDTKDITSYWYRRSVLGWTHRSIEYLPSPVIENAINDYRLTEKKVLIKSLNYVLNRKAKLNFYADSDILKIQGLDTATKVGLKVPTTLITKSKARLTEFISTNNTKVITKPIGDPLSFFEIGMHQFTSIVNPDMLADTFDYSLVQTAIQKKFELRIFYFNDTFYASAVFSQESEQTKVDLKNYDKENPNRVVPYELPADIEDKLRKLMQELNFQSGSIDMICDLEDNFIFLEVNPVGQFEQVSHPCNYNLYKSIANFL